MNYKKRKRGPSPCKYCGKDKQPTGRTWWCPECERKRRDGFELDVLLHIPGQGDECPQCGERDIFGGVCIGDCNHAAMPTPEQIRERCLEIQAGWTEADFQRRAAVSDRRHEWVVPLSPFLASAGRALKGDEANEPVRGFRVSGGTRG